MNTLNVCLFAGHLKTSFGNGVKIFIKIIGGYVMSSNSVKVWAEINDSTDSIVSVHWVPGECVNDYAHAAEGILYYVGDCPSHRYNTPVWSVVSEKDGAMILEFYAKNAGFAEAPVEDAELREISKQWLYPVSLPVVVAMEKDERGRYTRLNLRPDLNGTHAFKMYFLDKSVENPDGGFTVVSGIKEQPRCGFLVGKTFKGSFVPVDQMVKYVLDNVRELGNTSIVWYTSPVWGSYNRISCGNKSVFLTCDEEGLIRKIKSRSVLFDEELELSWTNAADYVWYHSCGKTLEQVMDEMVRYSFKCEDSALITTYTSEILERAAGYNMLRIYKVRSARAVVINEFIFSSAPRYFNREELHELLRVINEMNTQANERMYAALKKGKVMLGIA